MEDAEGMRINSGLLWSVAVGIVLSAVAWGKTQSDVAWMKESIARIEQQLERNESRRLNTLQP